MPRPRSPGVVWPDCTPTWTSTSENSLIWARLMAGSEARAQALPHDVERRERRSRAGSPSVNATRIRAQARAPSRVGTGIVMPSATKNSVMKKSRSDVTLAVTSSA